MTPEDTVLMHQYLYYVKGAPIWSDREYDQFCRQHDIHGGGGSDCAEHYPPHIIKAAEAQCE